MTAPRDLTPEEAKAIRSLELLGKRWPRTIMLVSMGGSLSVVSTDDEDFQGGSGPVRSEGVLAYIDGIPNTGGDW